VTRQSWFSVAPIPRQAGRQARRLLRGGRLLALGMPTLHAPRDDERRLFCQNPTVTFCREVQPPFVTGLAPGPGRPLLHQAPPLPAAAPLPASPAAAQGMVPYKAAGQRPCATQHPELHPSASGDPRANPLGLRALLPS